jgi:hypothetical protein
VTEQELTVGEFLQDKEAAKAEIKKLQQGNLDKVRALANLGKAMDLAYLANLKIDTFVEMFLDEDAKLVYVRNLETKLREDLDETLGQLRQDQLLAGVTEAKAKFKLPK